MEKPEERDESLLDLIASYGNKKSEQKEAVEALESTAESSAKGKGAKK
jgi:hypothetical protein